MTYICPECKKPNQKARYRRICTVCEVKRVKTNGLKRLNMMKNRTHINPESSIYCLRIRLAQRKWELEEMEKFPNALGDGNIRKSLRNEITALKHRIRDLSQGVAA